MGVDATLALRNLAEASKQNMYEVKNLADTMVWNLLIVNCTGEIFLFKCLILMTDIC